MFKREVIDQPHISSPTQMAESDTATTKMAGVYQSSANCSCGKVQARIQTLHTNQAPAPIRLVCYCRDCRGYFETLHNHQCKKQVPHHHDIREEEEVEETNGNENSTMQHLHHHASATDEWGGVDWTCLYPRDVQIVQGKELLKVVKIRPDSKIRQVYSTCCHSPMFRIGGVSLLVNTNIISSREMALPPIQYRIIGRQAWKNQKVAVKEAPLDQQPNNKKPKISWSLPWKWYFAMPQRIRSDLMEPMPLEFIESQVPVLEGFQEGSK